MGKKLSRNRTPKPQSGKVCPYCQMVSANKGSLVTHIMRKHPGADYTQEGIRRAALGGNRNNKQLDKRKKITLKNTMPTSMADAEKQDKRFRPHSKSVWTISGGGGPGTGKRR